MRIGKCLVNGSLRYEDLLSPYQNRKSTLWTGTQIAKASVTKVGKLALHTFTATLTSTSCVTSLIWPVSGGKFTCQ